LKSQIPQVLYQPVKAKLGVLWKNCANKFLQKFNGYWMSTKCAKCLLSVNITWLLWHSCVKKLVASVQGQFAQHW